MGIEPKFSTTLSVSPTRLSAFRLDNKERSTKVYSTSIFPENNVRLACIKHDGSFDALSPPPGDGKLHFLCYDLSLYSDYIFNSPIHSCKKNNKRGKINREEIKMTNKFIP